MQILLTISNLSFCGRRELSAGLHLQQKYQNYMAFSQSSYMFYRFRQRRI